MRAFQVRNRLIYTVIIKCVGVFATDPMPMKFKLSVLLYMCTFVYYNSYAEDAVIYQNSVTGRQVKATGTIENYSRDELLLRTSSGQIKTIETGSVVEVQADYPSTYLEAKLRMNNQEFEQALPLLDKALVQAPDGWMKHEILARQVECYSSLNRPDQAAVRYVQLIQLDPKSAFYDCVPLVWTSVELSPQTQQSVQSWTRQQKYPYAALLGASLLLTSDKKIEVQTTLNALAKSDDADVATLAQMQLNRLSLTPLSETALKNLEKKADALPRNLQYGPRFILGQLWSRSSADSAVKTDKAALSYLQCAANSKAPVELQARAFYSAGTVLLNAGNRDEAFRIFRRLIEKFPDSQWAQQAKRTAGGNL